MGGKWENIRIPKNFPVIMVSFLWSYWICWWCCFVLLVATEWTVQNPQNLCIFCWELILTFRAWCFTRVVPANGYNPPQVPQMCGCPGMSSTPSRIIHRATHILKEQRKCVILWFVTFVTFVNLFNKINKSIKFVNLLLLLFVPQINKIIKFCWFEIILLILFILLINKFCCNRFC